MKTLLIKLNLSFLIVVPAFAQSAGRHCLDGDSICNPSEAKSTFAGFERYQEVDAMGLNETGEQRILQAEAQRALKLYLGTRWQPHPVVPLDAKQADVTSSLGLKLAFTPRFE